MDIEKTEILDYDTVYWMDLKERISKKAPPQVPDGIDNDGFDNDKNEYITNEGSHFAYRYQIIKRLGKGSFG